MLRWLILLSVVALVIAPSFIIPFYLGRGAEWPVVTPNIPQDAAKFEALQDAYRLETRGNLEEALGYYRTAAKAKDMPIRELAVRGADRVYSKLTRLQIVYSDLRQTQEFLLAIRGPLLGLLLLILAIVLLNRLWPRRGIALRPFAMMPWIDENSSAAFNDVLSQEIKRIVRSYSSGQFSRLGVKITIPDLVVDGEQDDVWTRALSSLREGDLKTVGGFSIGELLRFFKNLGDRPAYLLSGSVTLLTSEARVRAQLKRISDDEIIAVWEASSCELRTFRPVRSERTKLFTSLSRKSKISPVAIHTTPVGDNRENAQFLAQSATVLACKIWHRLAQGASSPMRPSSWQTVFSFVQALQALELVE